MEQRLVEYVGRGEVLDLAADGEAVDEAAMRSWGDNRTCRAAVIRDILRGKLATDPDPRGLRLRSAKIAGRLDLDSLTTDVGLELEDCLLEEGVFARDAHLARVTLTRCWLGHAALPPLDADRLTCSRLSLRGARIIGHSKAGAIRLLGARISGDLDCEGANLHNESGPALAADGLQVGQSILLRGFTATGIRGLGAVRLTGAHIGGQFSCDGANLHNESGPALSADGLQVGQNMFLRHRFTAIGAGDDGAVRLTGAHIGLNFECVGATLRNESGPALTADGLQVGQHIFLTGGFTATGGGEGVALDLPAARVGGVLMFGAARLKHPTDSRRLVVDGLTYAGVPEAISARDWLNLLRNGTPRYAAQPYRQLAAGYRALGDERQARQILMEQRDDELTRTDPRWTEKLWGKITKFTLGYGYQPWRALLFLAAVVGISCLLAVVLGSHGALAQTKNTVAPGRPCTVIQRVSVGLDLNLPVGTSLARADCDLTRDPASAAATWLIAAGWVLRLLAWAFAALFIAGFTSAVRKT